jgi:hypothetical protein
MTENTRAAALLLLLWLIKLNSLVVAFAFAFAFALTAGGSVGGSVSVLFAVAASTIGMLSGVPGTVQGWYAFVTPNKPVLENMSENWSRISCRSFSASLTFFLLCLGGS